MKGLRKRWAERQLAAALRALPVVVVTGARQTGKTTLVRSFRPDRRYLTLDDLELLHQAETDPRSLLEPRPVTVDEVQRVPGLLSAVKRSVDRSRRSGDFMLTGSANLLLMNRVSESLAGRAVYLELPPFCATEWVESPGELGPLDRLFEDKFDPRDWPAGAGDWETWLLRGGFPAALSAESGESRDFWFRGYVQSYLERDLRQLSSVSSLPDFQRLMALAANQCARLVNQSNLARDGGLSQPTCHRYLNLLEAGCLLVRLPPLLSNPAQSLVKAPRLFWADCGLAAWLAGIRSPEGLRARADRGFWLEQLVFQTLQTWRSLDVTGRRLHYWRDRAGREVDFILEQDGRYVGLEIKLGTQVAASDTDGLRAWRSGLGPGRRFVRGAVLHGGEARPLGDDLFALPWGWMMP